MAKEIYLSLGSNLGDRRRMLAGALSALEARGVRILRVSPIYETEPQDLKEQGWFLNLVAEAETDLSPLDLLRAIAETERQFGRTRTVAKGPRTIDIDILLFGDMVIDTPELTVPHPRLAARRFVLAPLADLAPDLRHPVNGRTVREMLAETEGQAVRRVSERRGENGFQNDDDWFGEQHTP